MDKIAKVKKEIKRYIKSDILGIDKHLGLVRRIFEKIRPTVVEKTREILVRIKNRDMKYVKLYCKKEKKDEKLFVIPTKEEEVLKIFEEIREIKAEDTHRNRIWEMDTCFNDIGQFCYKLSSYVVNYDELEFNIEISMYANFLDELIHSNLSKLGYNNIKYNPIDKNLVLGFLEGKCTFYYLQGQVSGIWDNNFTI